MSWRLYDSTPDDPTIHIAPSFGREHELDIDCWCHPERDEDDPTGETLIHNAEH